jgi:hypothetical protein
MTDTMSTEDADLVKADLALSELPRAKALPRDQSLHIIRHLMSTTQNKGSRDRTIENARADAWLAICTIGQMLEKTGQCPDDQWQKAIDLTKRWRGRLVT